MELKREGITLSFDFEGTGERVFIFVHGLGINRTFFAPEARYFRHKGRVLNVDLRGHGLSNKPNHPYSVETYAEDIVTICKELKITQAIIVGHSIGGIIALEMSNRYPEIASALVLLDTSLFLTPKVLKFFSDKIAAFKAGKHEETFSEIVETRCLSTDKNKSRVKESFLETAPIAWHTSFESLVNWNTNRAEKCIQECRLPILYIEGPSLMINIEDFEQLYFSKLMLGKIVGAGHFFTLEVPDQVNAMIDRFLYIISAKK